VADFRYLNLRIGIAYLFQTAFEDAGDALFRGELDPRWLMGLWEEWATVVRKSASGRNGSAKDKNGSVGDGDDAPVMVDVYSGLLSDLEKLKGTTIKQIGLYFLSYPHHHSFTRAHALLQTQHTCNGIQYTYYRPYTHFHSLTRRFSCTYP
jgi:hypothetical protein